MATAGWPTATRTQRDMRVRAIACVLDIRATVCAVAVCRRALRRHRHLEELLHIDPGRPVPARHGQQQLPGLRARDRNPQVGAGLGELVGGDLLRAGWISAVLPERVGPPGSSTVD